KSRGVHAAQGCADYLRPRTACLGEKHLWQTKKRRVEVGAFRRGRPPLGLGLGKPPTLMIEHGQVVPREVAVEADRRAEEVRGLRMVQQLQITALRAGEVALLSV